MKIKWCKRTLISSPLHYSIVTSEKLAIAEMKRLKIDERFNFVIPGYDATTQFFRSEGNNDIAMVYFFNYREHKSIMNYAMIVHEAVHIWQRTRELIQEKNPSHEFEAYSIQMITQELMIEFDRQTKGKKK